MDFLWQDAMHAPFWFGVGQIILVNIILSGDNAVVIAMACLTLPPRQRLWGMVLGAGVAVLLRVIFTIIVSQAMDYPYLKLVGGALLFYVAIKLVTEDADGEEGDVQGGETLWRAVRIITIADIVMSLDNVLAIAGVAQISAAAVDPAHASAIKATLIIFGLATSVPLIVAGSAILMALLERFRVLVWAGGVLLGWVAGDIMATDIALGGWVGEPVLHQLHAWGGRIGGLIVMGAGYLMVRKHRALTLDEILAGVGLLIWIAVDIVIVRLFSGPNPDVFMIWSTRGVLVVVLIAGYAIVRHRSHAAKA